MNRYRRSLPCLLIAIGATAFVACDKKNDDAKDKTEPSASKVATDGTKPSPPEPKAPEVPKVPTTSTRLFDCPFVAWDGEGEERQAKFALTNKGKAIATFAQTWVYYYDKDGKQIDRYPHALGGKFKPSTAKEEKLGSKGDKIKSEVTAAACEVTSAKLVDGTEWVNENLVYNSMVNSRPLAGQTHKELLARMGTKIEAVWDGTPDAQAIFKLTNTTKRPVQVRTAWIYYYDETGKSLGRAVSNLYLKIEPGASVDQGLGHKADKLPKGTAVIEAGISKIDYLDGDKEMWLNRNQALTKRKMVAKRVEPAAPKE